MENSLNSPEGRRRFYIYSLLLMIILLLVRYFVLSNNNTINYDLEFISITRTIVDSIFVSLLTAFGLTIFYFNIAPKNGKKQIDLIDKDIFIYNKYKNLRKNATFWNFNGGIGRFTRNETLPKLLKITNKKNKRIIVTIIVLDPQNDIVCEKYANYKRSFDSKKNEIMWTKELVRKHIFATILKAAHYENQSSRLDVNIYVKQHFSLLRTDFTQNNILISKDDPKIPVISVEKKSYLYNPYVEDFEQCLKQAEQIYLEKKDSTFDKPIIQLTLEEVQQFFNNLSLERPPDKDEIDDILKIIKKDINPFKFKLKHLVPKIGKLS